MEREKKGIFFYLLCVVTAIVYGLLLELSKNVVAGWVVSVVAFALFIFIWKSKLRTSKWYLKLLEWAGLFVVLAIIYYVSYPPYARVPAVSNKNPDSTDIVSLEKGDVSGVFNEDKSVEVYAGIPYAKAPVCELRFKETEEAEAWEGTLVCDHFAPKFMQSENSTLWDSLVSIIFYNSFNWFDLDDNYREAMSEDALYVNVWKPAGDISDCPVIFYIHGGSLQTGSPSYDQYNGEAYAKRGIVFVDFGYRLNVFGYFADEALAEESRNNTTGNYGLLDQIAALKWVNENIEAFGGDAGNITIAGESAGSSSVNAICASPLTKGLFRRAIAESSGIVANKPYHTFRDYDEALEMKQTVYDAMGVSSVEELREIDAKELIKAAGEYNSMTVDGYALIEHPALTYQKGENHEEALLNGYNAKEADVFTILGTKVTSDIYLEILKENFGDQAEKIAELVPAGDNPKASYNTVMSVAWFAYSHNVWSRYMADEGRPAYEYWFTKENKGLSTNHSGELPYFYGNLYTQPQNYDESDYELSETIMDYVVNFAKTGDPNGEGLPEWQEFSTDETQILELGNEVEMTTDIYLELYKLIDGAQGK
ncbi:MAG: carboxylesterase family protein [Lachnospiraceae bacterium]|nr:carboxylesterase family protein [Lachnospiraceae bacterium]